MGRIFVLAAALLSCSPVYADWSFSWSTRTTGLTGGSSGSTKYFSYEAAMQALRLFELPNPPYTSGPMWKHAEPTHDVTQLFNPFLPTVGYVGAGGNPPGITGNSPAALCSTWVPLALAGCSGSFSGVVPFLPAGHLDWWTCWGDYSCSTGNYHISIGNLFPYCPEPGYGYTEFGTANDFHHRIAPPHMCSNLNWGDIVANFDLGKCNDACGGVGNPISPALGIKHQREGLFSILNPLFGLEWTWYYSSKIYNTAIKRAGWSHSYSGRLTMQDLYIGPVTSTGTVWAYRADGVILKYNLQSGVYVADGDISDRLTRLVDTSGKTSGWTYYASNSDDIESYDPYGRLVSIQRRTGPVLSLAYSDASTPLAVAPGAGYLIRVVDSAGRQANLSYDLAGNVISVADPVGNVFLIGYSANGNLQSIRHPDSNASGVNYIRNFHYENAIYPAALTGITDENGQRFSNYAYDSYGRAVRTEHAGGVNAFAIAFNANGSSAVTDPLGNVRTFNYALVVNAIKASGLSQPCATCADGAQAKTFDAKGNVDSRADFNGKKICYGFDLGRNLETVRVEGALSTENCSTVLSTLPNRPDVGKFSTQWHAAWRVPVKVAEPNRMTITIYNGDGGIYCAPTTAVVNGNPIGVPCKQSVQATADPTGQQGLAATLTGTARVWQHTYDSNGRVLTSTDPNNKVTTTTYHADNDPDLGKRGNVATIKNALGHVTVITAYDPNSRPLSITDPNGVITSMTYHPRGWLTSRTVGGETTTYDYDGVGQLIKVTLPDASIVKYTYDGAHRLTQIQDGLGNKIVYTLDAMGNRTKEQAFDPGGALARVRQQVYDSLNRLHQTVGAQ